MKHACFIFLLCANFVFAFAQTQVPQAASLGAARYTVICEDGDAAAAESIAREMEERFAVYNRLFRFDSADESAPGFSPLVVRVFSDGNAYNGYVAARLGSVHPGAVYLHYNQAERRELVINRGGADEGRALPYQAFIQYMRAFVSNPPAWMREGFAVYFNGLGYSGGALSYEENLSWLDTVKEMPNLPPPEEILLADLRGIPADFPGLAWSLVSFFLNSGNEQYMRAMTDSFLVLDYSKTAGENARTVARRITRWIDMEELERDYRQYLDSRKTFTWLLEEGQRAYAAGDTAGAELAFLSARGQRPSHYAPYYFLGLLSYEAGEFDAAENYYLSSLRLGADAALVSYALGVNAARAGKKLEAENYLRRAAETAPERYREKADALITGLR